MRANADANHGNEITWEAEADIVSGLGWLHCASRWAWDSEASDATSRSGVWTATLRGPLISQWQIHPVAIDLEKPSRSYRKVFIRNPNNTHWIGNLMTVEITRGELARNGKLASCWF